MNVSKKHLCYTAELLVFTAFKDLNISSTSEFNYEVWDGSILILVVLLIPSYGTYIFTHMNVGELGGGDHIPGVRVKVTNHTQWVSPLRYNNEIHQVDKCDCVYSHVWLLRCHCSFPLSGKPSVLDMDNFSNKRETPTVNTVDELVKFITSELQQERK